MSRKKLSFLILVIIAFALPVILILVKQDQDPRTSAAAADKLETEGGTLSSTGVTKQNDSQASGGQYVLFATQTPSPTPSSSTGVYGPGINIDSKNNYQVGQSTNQKVAHRFRASTTSNLNQILITLRMGPIYSGGTGGKLRISLQSDDGTANHFPSGNVLASFDYVPGNVEGGGTTQHSFPTPARLNKGSLYHIVYENIDSSPATNFVSVNQIFTFDKYSPRQPIVSDADYAVLTKTSGSWSVKASDTPSLDLVYADGTHDGIAYLQAFYDSDTQQIVSRITGAQMARELFTVTGGNKTVTKAFVRVGREFGTSPLTVSLKTGSGALIEAKTIPAASIALWAEYTVPQLYGPTSPTWASITFSTPHSLTNDQTYQLVLSSPSDSKYSMLPIRYKDFSGVDMASYAFRDGRAQDTQNGGSSWENVYSFQSESNMQFYFTTQ